MAITGPSATRFNSESVIIVAISMIRSFSGSRPVISRSIHTKRLWLGIRLDTYAVLVGCCRGCGVVFRKTLLQHIHVALRLRHPWLRRFSEHHPTPAFQTWYLPLFLCVAIPWKSAPWYLCGHGEAFPGVSEAMDGFSQAHRDVLVASPGKASPCPHLHQGQNPR